MAPQREWFEKDYYRVLGVPETASAKEIKSAYRKLSRQYHPDANEGDAAAEERFKEVSAAYDVVGNEERRKEYDEVRRLGPAAAGFPGGRRSRRVLLPGRRPRRPAGRLVRSRWSRRRSGTRRARSAPWAGPRDGAPPHLRRCRRGADHHGAPHQRRAMSHVQRLRAPGRAPAPSAARAAAARAWCPTTRACSPSRPRARCAPGVASRSTIRVRRVGARASSAARARSRSASPRVWPTANASG